MTNRVYLCILLYRLLKSRPSSAVRDWNLYTYWATGNFRVKDLLLLPLKTGGAGVRGFTTGQASSDDDVQVLRPPRSPRGKFETRDSKSTVYVVQIQMSIILEEIKRF